MSVGKGAARSAADLRGGTVGTAGISYQAAYLKTILARAHVPSSSVKVTSVGFNLVPAMLSHKVDATLGAFWNVEGIQLRQAGRKPAVTPVDRLGVPTYDELVLVARRDYAGSHGSEIRRFVQALGRGYAEARQDPSGGVRALVQQVPDLRSSSKLLGAQVRATLLVVFPGGGKPFGWQRPSEWQAYGRWMWHNHLLSHDPHAGEAVTNEFLAGQGG
jgi:putative hydroxymethylpyrimidine transport system substrate-binding protein